MWVPASENLRTTCREQLQIAADAGNGRLVGVSIALIGRMLGFTRQVAKA